jgi:hypothetical protein
VKQNLLFSLIPTIVVFLAISIFWVISGVSNLEIFYLFIGLLLGNILLDLDHFIYWFIRKPNTDESRLVRTIVNKKDIHSTHRLIKAARTSHTNLIFHHYFFQISLNFLSFFIFISSTNTIVLSLLVSANLHLLIDEIRDYFKNPKHLQDWLFAREEKQLPIRFLKKYLITFTILFFIFLFLLVKSKT